MQHDTFIKSLEMLDIRLEENVSHNMVSDAPVRLLVGDFYYDGRIAYHAPARLITVFDKDNNPIGCVSLDAVSVIEPRVLDSAS